MTTLNSRVAGNIRAELARKGYTHEQVAKTFDVSRQAIGNRLDGTTRLTLDDVEKFAGALEIDPIKLLTD